MKKKLLQTCLFLTLFGLLLITPIGRVSASSEWNLQVTNLAGTTVNYSYDQLLAMPESNVSAAEYCYGSLVTSGNWGGVSLSYLLQQAGLDPAVASVAFQASDGYAVSIPLQEAIQSDVIIAYQLNDSPLSEGLRLVVPEENGNIWIAMITSITMSTSVVSVSQSVADERRDCRQLTQPGNLRLSNKSPFQHNPPLRQKMRPALNQLHLQQMLLNPHRKHLILQKPALRV